MPVGKANPSRKPKGSTAAREIEIRTRRDCAEGRKDAPAHFLGAMVLDQKQVPITHVERRLVIDGQ
jgi:hypothetical protein